MDFLYYLLEANVYLIAFYGFYWLFLKQETFYQLNRVYILLSLLFSFLVPLTQLGFLSRASMDYTYSAAVSEATPLSPFHYLLIAYGLVSLVLLLRFFYNISALLLMTRKLKKKRFKEISYYALQNTKDQAFSFFNLIYIHPNISDKETVIEHERIHVKQLHSMDVVLLELISIICWFNPGIYLLKQDMRLLHEYLADEKASVDKHNYALLLISNSLYIQKHTLRSQLFNQSFLKRRIIMLNQKKSSGISRLKLLVQIPMVACFVAISSVSFSKSYVLMDFYPQQETGQKLAPPPPPVVRMKKNIAPPLPPVVRKKTNVAPPPPQVERDKKNVTNKVYDVVMPDNKN